MSNDSLLANRQIEAAITIQRWYRYLKVSQHFKSIIHDALQKKKSGNNFIFIFYEKTLVHSK